MMRLDGPGGVAVSRVFPLLLLLTLTLAAPGVAADAPLWRDTGIHLTNASYRFCIDATQPTTFLARDEPTGTAAYNWATGEKRLIQSRTYDACSEQTGNLYARNPDGTAFRFSAADPTGATIDHFPTNLAMDGSPFLYALQEPRYADFLATTVSAPGRLWVSEDAGATWAERGGEFGGAIIDIAPVDADARAVYALVQQRVIDPEKHVVATLYFSADAGATWEKRNERSVGLSGSLEWPLVSITRVPGRVAGVDTIQFATRPGYPGSSSYSTFFLSTDGGRTFNEAGKNGLGVQTQLVATRAGIVRFTLRGGAVPSGYALSRTGDGGATWEALPFPVSPSASADSGGTFSLLGVPGAPATLFLVNNGQVVVHGQYDLFVSTDAGTTWQRLAEFRVGVHVTPTAPLALLGFGPTSTYSPDGNVQVLDLSGMPLA